LTFSNNFHFSSKQKANIKGKDFHRICGKIVKKRFNIGLIFMHCMKIRQFAQKMGTLIKSLIIKELYNVLKINELRMGLEKEDGFLLFDLVEVKEY